MAVFAGERSEAATSDWHGVQAATAAGPVEWLHVLADAGVHVCGLTQLRHHAPVGLACAVVPRNRALVL